jgi:hypothetical protein
MCCILGGIGGFPIPTDASPTVTAPGAASFLDPVAPSHSSSRRCGLLLPPAPNSNRESRRTSSRRDPGLRPSPPPPSPGSGGTNPGCVWSPKPRLHTAAPLGPRRQASSTVGGSTGWRPRRRGAARRHGAARRRELHGRQDPGLRVLQGGAPRPATPVAPTQIRRCGSTPMQVGSDTDGAGGAKLRPLPPLLRPRFRLTQPR